MSPYVQSTMAQAMQAMLTGAPLPANCYVMSIPMEQAQQMFPQVMTGGVSGFGGPLMYAPPPSYYGQGYPGISVTPYPLGNALVPYGQHYGQGYGQVPNYPMIDYAKSKKKGRRGRKAHSEPHSNLYNSSSFDSHMENLSWSRLFDRHHRRSHSQPNKRHSNALSYDQKSGSSKQRTATRSASLSSSGSSTTTSDETIRRVNLSTKQPSTSSAPKQQTKSSLPFKYSSEFVPGVGGKQSSQKSSKKEGKLRSDDVFVVQKTPPVSSQQQSLHWNPAV